MDSVHDIVSSLCMVTYDIVVEYIMLLYISDQDTQRQICLAHGLKYLSAENCTDLILFIHVLVVFVLSCMQVGRVNALPVFPDPEEVSPGTDSPPPDASVSSNTYFADIIQGRTHLREPLAMRSRTRSPCVSHRGPGS